MRKEDRRLGAPVHELPIVQDRAWCQRCEIHVPWTPETRSAGGHGHVGAEGCCTGCPGPYAALRVDRSQAAPSTTELPEGGSDE